MPHHTIARCADRANRKKIPSESNDVHGVWSERRIRNTATASADPIVNQPGTVASVSGAHSLIVSRMTGFVARSYAYVQTRGPKGFAKVATVVTPSIRSVRRAPGSRTRRSSSQASPRIRGNIVKLPWIFAHKAANTGPPTAAPDVGAARGDPQGALRTGARQRAAVASRGRATPPRSQRS
jgi:hypothetical protein